MSSLCYVALYVLIGIAFSARATVVAVVYTLLFEGVLSTIPATINKFTVCYTLRALLAEGVAIKTERHRSELPKYVAGKRQIATNRLRAQDTPS